ncbi:MAG: TlpA disulfide reductase family protein [Microthrixaceae bacterium]
MCSRGSGMREFAESHADELDVIGIGTQDDPVMAQEFVDRHGIAFLMLWDETFETWNAFGITAQPATALFDGEGTVIEGWMGGLPEQRVLNSSRTRPWPSPEHRGAARRTASE